MLQFESWKRVLIWITCLVGLLLAVPNGFYTRVEQHNDAVASIELGADTPENQEMAAQWPSYLPSSLVNLGLDLRGGAHLLAEVKLEEVYASRIDGYWPEARDTLRGLRDQIGGIRRVAEGPRDELRIRISDPAGLQAAVDAANA